MENRILDFNTPSCGGTPFGLYCIVDQGVTITYMREGYEDTENDLNTIIGLLNDTDLSKKQIQ